MTTEHPRVQTVMFNDHGMAIVHGTISHSSYSTLSVYQCDAKGDFNRKEERKSNIWSFGRFSEFASESSFYTDYKNDKGYYECLRISLGDLDKMDRITHPPGRLVGVINSNTWIIVTDGNKDKEKALYVWDPNMKEIKECISIPANDGIAESTCVVGDYLIVIFKLGSKTTLRGISTLSWKLVFSFDVDNLKSEPLISAYGCRHFLVGSSGDKKLFIYRSVRPVKLELEISIEKQLNIGTDHRGNCLESIRYNDGRLYMAMSCDDRSTLTLFVYKVDDYLGDPKLKLLGEKRIMAAQGGPKTFDCNVAFCPEDEDIGEVFKDKLKDRNFTVFEGREIGKTDCENCADGIHQCEKTIILVSPNWVKSACTDKSDKTYLTKFEHDMAVAKDWMKVHHKFVIIDGVNDKAKGYPKQCDGCKFPRVYHPGVTEEFWDELAAFVKKDGVSWGDPAHGNAWSYYDGYLKIVFDVKSDFKRCVEDCKKANNLPPDARVCEKLLVLCPKNTAPLILKECANITALDEVIKIGAHNVAGNYRGYDVTMYRVTRKNAQGENVTIYLPMTVNLTLVHMYKMCEDKFFNVDKTQMQTQGIIFIHILKQILRQMKLSEKVQILTLEGIDNTDQLADLIVQNVKFPEEC